MSEYKRNMDILNKHKQVVENQKWAYNYIVNNLDNESCVLILDFKENFDLMQINFIYIYSSCCRNLNSIKNI